MCLFVCFTKCSHPKFASFSVFPALSSSSRTPFSATPRDGGGSSPPRSDRRERVDHEDPRGDSRRARSSSANLVPHNGVLHFSPTIDLTGNMSSTRQQPTSPCPLHGRHSSGAPPLPSLALSAALCLCQVAKVAKVAKTCPTVRSASPTRTSGQTGRLPDALGPAC